MSMLCLSLRDFPHSCTGKTSQITREACFQTVSGFQTGCPGHAWGRGKGGKGEVPTSIVEQGCAGTGGRRAMCFIS